MYKFILSIVLLISSVFGYTTYPPAPDGELRDLMNAKGLRFETYLDFAAPSWYADTSSYKPTAIKQYNFLPKNFNNVLHTNAFEFHVISTGYKTYDFTKPDAMALKADSMGFKLHLNALIWATYTGTTAPSPPTWLEEGGYNTAQIKTIMNEFVDTIVSRYHDVLYSLEPTNEIVAAGYVDSTTWYALNVPNYWLDIYRHADSVCGQYGIKTVLNETSHLCWGNNDLALLKLLHQFKDSSVNIDIIGLQAHQTANDTNDRFMHYNYSDIQNIIDSIRSIGFDSIRVTELDWGIQNSIADTVNILKRSRNNYANFFYICYKNKIPISLWGFTNTTNWRISGGYKFPCLWDTVAYDTTYVTMPAYQAVKRLLQDSLKSSKSSLSYQIKANYFKNLRYDANFCFWINLNHIKLKRFWDLLNSTGSNLYVTDSIGDTIPIYLSKFNKANKRGIVELTKEFPDSNYQIFNINISTTDTFYNKNTIALSAAGIVWSPDFSSANDKIFDKCGNANLDNLYGIGASNITLDGIRNTTTASYATSSNYSNTLALSEGTLSIFESTYDTLKDNKVRYQVKLSTSDNTSVAALHISGIYVNFGGYLKAPNYAAQADIMTQYTDYPTVWRLVSRKPYNQTMSWGTKGRHQKLNDIHRYSVSSTNAHLTWNSGANVTLFDQTNATNSEIYNIRLFNYKQSHFQVSTYNQMFIDQKNFYTYPDSVVSYTTLDSSKYDIWSYTQYLSLNEFSDSVTITMYDSSTGATSYTVRDSIFKSYRSSFKLVSYSKAASTTYYVKIKVAHNDGSLEWLYDTISTGSTVIDTIVLDTINIKYKFSNAVPLKCNNMLINATDTVTINGPLFIRDSINIDRRSTKIKYNGSGVIYGWIYPSNKLYIRTNNIQNVPPVRKATYRTWYIWR